MPGQETRIELTSLPHQRRGEVMCSSRLHARDVGACLGLEPRGCFMLQIRGRDLLCCEVCTLQANENANSSFKIFMSENYLRGTSPRKARILVIAGAGCTVGQAYMSSPTCIIPFCPFIRCWSPWAGSQPLASPPG